MTNTYTEEHSVKLQPFVQMSYLFPIKTQKLEDLTMIGCSCEKCEGPLNWIFATHCGVICVLKKKKKKAKTTRLQGIFHSEGAFI